MLDLKKSDHLVTVFWIILISSLVLNLLCDMKCFLRKSNYLLNATYMSFNTPLLLIMRLCFNYLFLFITGRSSNLHLMEISTRYHLYGSIKVSAHALRLSIAFSCYLNYIFKSLRNASFLARNLIPKKSLLNRYLLLPFYNK